MEQKLLNEINRFREIGGLPLLNEQYTWLDNLISSQRTRFSGLDSIIKHLGYEGKSLTDEEIDNIVDELKNVGIGDTAIDNLRAVLKKDANVKKALTTSSDDFVDALNKARLSKGTKTGVSLNKLDEFLTLSKQQILQVAKNVVTKQWDTLGSNLREAYTNIDDQFSDALKTMYKYNDVLYNIDEIYDIIDLRVNTILGSGKYSNEIAEEILQKMKTEIRTNSKTKEMLDKFKSEGKVSSNPKRTESIPNFNKEKTLSDDWLETKNWTSNSTFKGNESAGGVVGDIPKISRTQSKGLGTEVVSLADNVAEKYNKILEKIKNNVELTEAETKFKESVESWKSGSDEVFDWDNLIAKTEYIASDWDKFGSTFKRVAQTHSWFKEFYVNTLRPYYRIWLSGAESLFTKMDTAAWTRAANEFTESMGKGFDDYVKNIQSYTKNPEEFFKSSYVSDIKDKLIKLKNDFTPSNPNLKAINATYKQMWDNFCENARKQLTGDDLDNFNAFVKTVENTPGDAFYEVSMKEIFSEGLPDFGESLGKVENASNIVDNGVTAYKQGASSINSSKLIEKILQKITTYYNNLWSFFLNGFFATPREAQLYYIKKGVGRSKIDIPLIKGKKVTVPFVKVKGPVNFLIGRIVIAKLFLPVAFGLVIAAWDGVQRLAGLKNEKLDENEKGIIPFLELYVYEPIKKSLFGNGPIKLAYESYYGKPYGRSWCDIAEIFLPGYRDDTVLELIDLWSRSVMGGGQTEEEVISDTQKKATEESTKESLKFVNTQSEKNYKQADEETKKLIENSTTIFSTIKSSLDDGDYDITGLSTKEESRFIRSKIKFIPQVPADYFKFVKEKLNQIKDSEDSDDIKLLNKIKSNLGNVNLDNLDFSNIESIRKNTKSFTGGSVVLTGKSGKMYLVVSADRELPSVTQNMIDTVFTDYYVKWVKPSFYNLKVGTEREYFNLKEFIKQYDKL